MNQMELFRTGDHPGNVVLPGNPKYNVSNYKIVVGTIHG